MNKRWICNLFLVFALLISCALQSGCALCCGTYDEAYAGHGGKYQRENLFHGRVGSPFSDPNAQGHTAEYIEAYDDSQLEVIE